MHSCWVDRPPNEVVIGGLEYVVEASAPAKCSRPCDKEVVRRKTQFNQLRIPAYKQDSILEKVKGQHYQLACGTCFEATQGAPLMQGVSHPNEYFRESRKLRLGGEGGKENMAPKTPGPAGARTPPPRTPNLAAPMET